MPSRSIPIYLRHEKNFELLLLIILSTICATNISQAVEKRVAKISSYARTQAKMT